MFLLCIEVKRFEISIFSCTWLLHQMAANLQCYRPTQFSGTEVRSENCKFVICAQSCAPPRFGLMQYCRRFVQYGVRNYESTLMQLWKCLLFHRFDRPARQCIMHQTTLKTKGWQLQRAFKTRWLSSEATVRARSEILAFAPR